MGSVTDGLSNTLMVAEVLQGRGSDLRGFAWWSAAAAASTYYGPNTVSPDVTTQNCATDVLANLPCVNSTAAPWINSFRSRHTGGVQACMGDGSVQFFSQTIDVPTWQNLGTFGDGNVVNAFN